MDWKNNLLTPKRNERLFKVGKFNMILGDLVRLGFQPENFTEVTDPWAKKSNYDVNVIAQTMIGTVLKAEKNILEKMTETEAEK